MVDNLKENDSTCSKKSYMSISSDLSLDCRSAKDISNDMYTVESGTPRNTSFYCQGKLVKIHLSTRAAIGIASELAFLFRWDS